MRARIGARRCADLGTVLLPGRWRNYAHIHRAFQDETVLGAVNALRQLSHCFDRAFRAAFGR
jgi:hypothetical protein